MKHILFVLLVLISCKSEKEGHRVQEDGTEWGVRIEVVLKGGGSAVLICPKFNGKPMGSHGRECYLDSYIQ